MKIGEAVFLIILFAAVAFVLGINLGIAAGLELRDEAIGAPVENQVCYDSGCSFLVEYSNGSREWLWQPKLVRGEKK